MQLKTNKMWISSFESIWHKTCQNFTEIKNSCIFVGQRNYILWTFSVLSYLKIKGRVLWFSIGGYVAVSIYPVSLCPVHSNLSN